MNKYVFLILLIPACVYGGAMYNCEYSPKCLDIEASGDFLFTEKEILAQCDKFQKFQVCLDNWGKQCLSPQQLQDMRAQLEKPLQMVRKMCTDPDFRKEYLDSKDSFEKIKDDWKKCTVEFEDDVKKAALVTDPMEQKKQFCCGLKEFDDCSGDLCENKCTASAAKILNDTINLSKEVVTVQCTDEILKDCPKDDDDDDDDDDSPGASSHLVPLHAVYLVLSAMFVVLFR